MLILVFLSVCGVNGQFITANDGVEPASEILIEQCYGFKLISSSLTSGFFFIGNSLKSSFNEL